ncbi:MAG: aspartate--tRNA ligase [Candidatus Latescibacterota bacterium]|nr:MAG: aspartate--tRNA ligase [Candidatus Latescibacterota bacterium]
MERTRTHTCGELRAERAGEPTVIMGWVHRLRDQGGIFFFDLRDRFGMTQVVVEPNGPVAIDSVRELRREYVVGVKGRVRIRPEGIRNANLPTGEIEVVAEELEVLNRAETPPFVIEEEVDATEEMRLRYRFLDLRRPSMQRRIVLRHRAAQTVRRYLSDHGFLEIETPLLVRSSPEGARDFLVPSRLSPGKFYSLPQSPQIYKQILMVCGFDRYFQIAKCLRDEDLRADRQPEFTQIDCELSFTHEEEVFRIMEGLMAAIWKETIGQGVLTPFPILNYEEAMERYGSDKPDVRFELHLADLDEAARASSFQAFRSAQEEGGTVRGLVVPGGASFSRKEIDGLEALAKKHGAKGLAWTRVKDGALDGGVGKFFEAAALRAASGAGEGDLLLMVAGPRKKALVSLGAVRVEVGRKLGLAREGELRFLWVNRFPLFEWNEDESRWEPAHHMFTMPFDDSIPLLETDPGKAYAHLYDLVLNGVEIASGSIRNHDPDLQRRVMDVVGIRGEDQDRRFGFLLNALRYGAPPHGGIAFGWDRIVLLMTGGESLRDVIAYPKTTSGLSLMDGSPSEVEEELLRDLGLERRKT